MKRFRLNLDLSQEAVAEYLNITREEVSYYENGHRNIPTKVISGFSKLAGVQEFDLYEENGAVSALNLAFAFRADDLSKTDFETIAGFKKIVLNYIKMRDLSA